MGPIKRSLSFYSIVLCIAIILVAFFSYDIYKENRLKIDAPSFYAYLPVLFLNGDADLSEKNEIEYFKAYRPWFVKVEDHYLVKHTMGLALVLSPFFLIAHLLAHILSFDHGGFSIFYQNILNLGVIFYLGIGLYSLRKQLLKFFDEKAVTLCLLSLVLGTYIFYYSVIEPFMSHAITFSFMCIALLNYFEWLEKDDRRSLIILSVSSGLLILLRPTMVFFLVFIIAYLYFYTGSFAGFLDFIKSRSNKIIIAAVVVILIFSPQLIYWKLASGNWFIDQYQGERFLFHKPAILEFLFGFRKGLFIYAPLLLFAVPGFYYLYKSKKDLFWASISIFFVSVYVFSSWWVWTYGVSWGIRVMIDYLPFLAFPIAAFYNNLTQSRIRLLLVSTLVLIMIVFHQFQTWQYKNKLIHFDDMTYKAYVNGLFQTRQNREWGKYLEPKDWESRIMNVKSKVNTKRSFESLNLSDPIFFRADNGSYITANPRYPFALAALSPAHSNNEKFHLRFLSRNKVLIQHQNGNFLTMIEDKESYICASSKRVEEAQIFLYDFGENFKNEVRFYTSDGRNLSYKQDSPHLLYLSQDDNQTYFRFYELN